MAKQPIPPANSSNPNQSSMQSACRAKVRLSNGAVWARAGRGHATMTNSVAGPKVRPSLLQWGQGPQLEEQMDFDYSPRQKEWMKRVGDFMEHHIYPAEETYTAQMNAAREKS